MHTRPAHVLAAERVRFPHASRGWRDARRHFGRWRVLKEDGLACAYAADVTLAVWPSMPLPRVHVARPVVGFVHPVTRADLCWLLRVLGEAYTYGLRSIELAARRDEVRAGGLCFARLVVPGRIVLYPQPASPWTLLGTPAQHDLQRLRAAGALVEVVGDGAQTTVHWPTGALRVFMLVDVLAHEIGHHMLQQYTGKRLARVARTADHEAFAEQLAQRVRRLLREHGLDAA